METQVKTIKNQFKDTELMENYNNILPKINEVIKTYDYRVTVNRQEVDTIDIIPDFSKLTSKNSRKKVAKKLYYVTRKPNRRNINSLFSYLYKHNVINKQVLVNIGLKEAEIIRLRRTYKVMLKKTEETRLTYLESKGDFYKKRLAFLK